MKEFNPHPKGCFVLDGVDVETTRTGPKATMTSGIRISHPSFGARSLVLCASDDTERNKWVAALQASRNM